MLLPLPAALHTSADDKDFNRQVNYHALVTPAIHFLYCFSDTGSWGSLEPIPRNSEHEARDTLDQARRRAQSHPFTHYKQFGTQRMSLDCGRKLEETPERAQHANYTHTGKRWDSNTQSWTCKTNVLTSKPKPQGENLDSNNIFNCEHHHISELKRF